MPIRIMTKGETAQKAAATNLFGLPDADPDVEQLPEGLSFCMIMKNEERFLENCLKSIASVVDEICIVDTGSTDRSIEIAKSFGARIEEIEWPRDFAKARNHSLRMAKYRWILTLDADEEVTPQSLFALKEIKRVKAATTAVVCRINNQTHDHDGVESTFSHYLPRLFPNTSRLRYFGAVHERLVVDDDYGAPMVDSPIVLLHFGYQEEILIGRDKTNRNLPLIMREAEENPNDTFCLFNLAMMQMSLEKSDESIANFEKMFEIANEKKEKATRAYFAPAYITLAMLYYRVEGDYDKAMALIDKCLEINEYYPNALYFKSNLYAIKGDHEGARTCLIKAVDAQEFIRAYAFVDEEICHWKAKYYLGLSYAGTQEYDEALAWLDRALEARSGFLEIRLARASVLESMGNIVEAEREYHAIFDEFKSDFALLRYVGCLMRLKRYEKIVNVVVREVEDRGDAARMQVYLSAAQAAHRIQRNDALDFVRKAQALERHPHSGVVLQALEELYAEMGLEEDRIELREWELRDPPPCRHAHDFARRASRYIEEEQFEKALEAAKAGLVGTADNPHLLLNAAVAESRLGLEEAAIARLSQVDPYLNLEVYLIAAYMRAALLQKNEKFEAALDAVTGLLKWKPDQKDALMLRGRLYVDLGRNADAEQAYLDAMVYDLPRASMELASFYLRSGRFEDAERVANLALAGSGVAA